MISFSAFQQLALSFPQVTEAPHFEKTSFRINKKIFSTYDAKNNRACLKLSAADQSVFCLIDKTIIYPVPNKWGLQGWTLFELKKIRKDIFKDALKCAYNQSAPTKKVINIKGKK